MDVKIVLGFICLFICTVIIPTSQVQKAKNKQKPVQRQTTNRITKRPQYVYKHTTQKRHNPKPTTKRFHVEQGGSITDNTFRNMTLAQFLRKVKSLQGVDRSLYLQKLEEEILWLTGDERTKAYWQAVKNLRKLFVYFNGLRKMESFKNLTTSQIMGYMNTYPMTIVNVLTLKQQLNKMIKQAQSDMYMALLKLSEPRSGVTDEYFRNRTQNRERHF